MSKTLIKGAYVISMDDKIGTLKKGDGMGSFGGIAFAADSVRHEDNPLAIGMSALFFLACLNAGVALGPGGLFAFSTVVDDRALTHAVAGMERALQDVAA